MPTYDELITFIREYVMELETLQPDRPVCDSRPAPLIMNAGTTVKSQDNCVACGMGHRLYFCAQFKQMPVTQRAAIVNDAGLCVNCLFGKHSSATCKYGTCRVCDSKHHTLLHNPDSDIARGSGTNRSEEQSSVSNFDGIDRLLSVPVPLSLSAHTHSGTKRLDLSPSNQVFLATAVVKVLGPMGTSFSARVLLDSASQPNLMTERFHRLLNSRKTPGNTEIAGIGGNISAVSLYSTTATVVSRFNKYRVPLEFIVLEKVTSDLPTNTADVSDWMIPKNVRLADPSFATRAPIDMVIGAQVFFELLRSGHFKLGEGKPMLQNSVFGWLVSGIHDCGSSKNTVRVHCNVSRFHDSEHNVSGKGQTNSSSPEGRFCKNYLESATRKDVSAQYNVSLPKKPEMIGQPTLPSIARFVLPENELAYSSLRVYDACHSSTLTSGAFTVYLTTATSSIASTKKSRCATIARLELCASHAANSFVAIRVSQIQQLTENAAWLDLRTEHNLATQVSRSLSPEYIVAFCTHQYWILETFGYLDSFSSCLQNLSCKMAIYAPTTFNRKHPFNIQKKNFVTNLILPEAHEETPNAGPPHLLTVVRRFDWSIDGPYRPRNTVHKYIVEHHPHPNLVVLQTLDEMTTKVTRIEACLKPRPLTSRSNNPTDLEALHPGHFRIAGPIQALSDPNLTLLPSNHPFHWQDQQRVLQTLWDRWYDYLPTLQRSQKWPAQYPNLSVGDMVLVEDDTLPPIKWSIARVLKTIVGDDACGRVADVLCDGNQIRRCSIRKMCPLPHCEASESSTVTESERQPSAPSCTPQPSPTIDLQATSTLPAAAQCVLLPTTRLVPTATATKRWRSRLPSVIHRSHRVTHHQQPFYPSEVLLKWTFQGGRHVPTQSHRSDSASTQNEIHKI